jgi:tetratricopeptide (TPR) repeat protein
LHKKTSTNYRKWDYFESSEEEEVQPDFVPPENDPAFAALETDIKERGARRKAGKIKAEELKEIGNKFMSEGKYRNAIAKYEEATTHKKDWMILYTNASLARLKLEEWEKVIEECTRVTEYYEVFEEEMPRNKMTYFKALTRRG